MRNKAFSLVKFCLVFAILFDVNFVFLPSITSGRAAFFILLFFGIKTLKLPKTILFFLGFVLTLTIIALMQSLISSDFTQFSRLLWFTIYGLLTPVLISKYITDRNEFLMLVSAAVSLQAILIILSFTVPTVKQIFYNLIIFTSNFDSTVTLRATGFASIGGAGLSVIQSLGIIAILLYMHLNTLSMIKKLGLWLTILIISISIFVTGRTGLLVSGLALAAYFVIDKAFLKNLAIVSMVFLMLTQIDYTSLLEKSMSSVEGFDINLFTGWINNAFSTENNATASDLKDMPIPPLTLKTVVGTGRVVDKSGVGNASQNDSGYIQSYYSLGILLSFLFYVFYLLFLVYFIRKKGKPILYIPVIILFFIEVKEPFIFQYVFPFFILTAILVINKMIEEQNVYSDLRIAKI